MEATKAWYVYAPHWHFLQGPGGNVPMIARQDTYLKRSTALSWELPEESLRFIPSGTQLDASSISRVSDPSELNRHQGSADHCVVTLYPTSTSKANLLEGTWYLYRPHWRIDSVASKPSLTALEETWLKRRCELSSNLAAAEKLAISAGEVLGSQSSELLDKEGAPRAGHSGASCNAASAACSAGPSQRASSGLLEVSEASPSAANRFAAEHLQVVIDLALLKRLRTNVPRRALCKYFSQDRQELLASLHSCFQDHHFGPGVDVGLATQGCSSRPPAALFVPHGAFCNSGFVAAHAYASLLNRPRNFSKVVLIGNNHAAWNKIALCDQKWTTPLGSFELDRAGFERLSASGFLVDRAVHREEHSIENQLPFLQFLNVNAQILPIGVGSVSLDEAHRIAKAIVEVSKSEDVLLIGTSDFSHEGPAYGGPTLSMQDVTNLTIRKDSPLLAAVQAMDVEQLLSLGRGSSMCGVGAASVFLLCCRHLGYTKCRLLKYLVNTMVTPCDSTTGFASMLFERG